MQNNQQQQQQQQLAPAEKLGMVDTISPDPSIKQTQSYLEADSKPPLEGKIQPALTLNPDVPGLNYDGTGNIDKGTQGYVPGGTILTDNIYEFSDRGVHQVHEYSHNTSAKHEAHMKQEQQRVQVTGRSIYQTPPKSGGFKPYVDVSEPPKPTEEQLALLKTRDRLITINNKLRLLQLDEQRYETKLANVRRAMKSLRLEAEDLS